MKKTFKLQVEGKNSDRVLDAIKHEIRKYVKRERNKALPQGSNYWAFDCRLGQTAELAEPLHVGEITKQMDVLATSGSETCYVEILARAAIYTPKEQSSDMDDELDE